MQKKTRGVGDVWQSESSLAAKPEWLAGLYYQIYYSTCCGQDAEDVDSSHGAGTIERQIVQIGVGLSLFTRAWRDVVRWQELWLVVYCTQTVDPRVDRRVSPRVDPGSILTDCHEHLSGSARLYDPHCPPTDQHKLGQRWAITAACRVKVTTPTLCHCH